MLPPIPADQSLVALLTLSSANALALRLFLRSAWRDRFLRIAVFAAIALLLSAHVAWCFGTRVRFELSYYGAALASSGNVVLAFLLLSLPIAAIVRALVHRSFGYLRSAPPPRPLATQPITVDRRTFVKMATAAVPVASVGTALSGFRGAGDLPLVPRRELTLSRLAPKLDGLTVLQLSDLHLGAGRTLNDLEESLRRITESGRPDLIVITGDIADDMDQLAPALDLISGARARFGAFACLGNHEYLHDVARARRTFDRSSIPLLVDEGVKVATPNGELYLAGANDPFGREFKTSLARSVEASLRNAPRGACTLLLSHRPEGFEPAAKHRIDLTLSGHTHGGQIGFAGKSAFEPLFTDGYLWGAYGRGNARLYTTSGFGHWFPFRLGCPTETPLLVLRSPANAGANHTQA